MTALAASLLPAAFFTAILLAALLASLLPALLASALLPTTLLSAALLLIVLFVTHGKFSFVGQTAGHQDAPPFVASG